MSGVAPALSRRQALSLSLIIMAGGCGKESPPLAYPDGPDQANRDHEIFDIVLSDLIDYEEFDPAVGGRGVNKSQIVLSDTTLKQRFSDRLLDGRPCNLPKEIPSEIWADLIRRNAQGKRYSLARYHPSNPHILVRDLSQTDLDGFGGVFPDARGYVELSLPGYSRGGQTALFHFTFGPTPHGAVGDYLLSRVKGRWEIVGRFIGYFD
jgi:hypothetical protein